MVLQAALTYFFEAPLQLQHWPATFEVLIFVHAAVQAPEVVVLSSVRPKVGSIETVVPVLLNARKGLAVPPTNISLFLS